jgi:hypothetical protein
MDTDGRANRAGERLIVFETERLALRRLVPDEFRPR